MPLFNYLTHHLGSFGSIYDSTLINGFAPRMRRPTYGDRIVEIPINHTKDCLLYRNNSLRAAFKYKLILGTAGAQVARRRQCDAWAYLYLQPTSTSCVHSYRSSQTGSQVELKATVHNLRFSCTMHSQACHTVYTSITCVCTFWLVDSSVYYIYIYMCTRGD